MPERSTESRPEGGGEEVDADGGTHGGDDSAKDEEPDGLKKTGLD